MIFPLLNHPLVSLISWIGVDVEMVYHFLSFFFIPQVLVLLSCKGDITVIRFVCYVGMEAVKWYSVGFSVIQRNMLCRDGLLIK